MTKDGNVESMFSRFSKIVCELKSLRMVYSNALQVRLLIRSLPKAWETKAVILEDGDLQKMTYDKLRGNLMAYEQNHINRYNKDDKKETVVFTTETSKIGEEADEDQDEGLALINRGEKSKKTYKKGMWALNSGCSRHMCGKKENFKTIKRIDGGCVRFGDNAKGEVTRVGTITLSSSCDLVEVYLVEGLKHNLLNISQLCDAGFQVTFNTANCIIKHLEKKLTLIGDRVNNIYVLNNVDFPSLTCITAVSSDPWLWHQKLGHASMHALEKRSRLELVIGLPKLKF
ncbi:uncharacterized protein [Solanum tuberosum]|uniref:uncharacterized protein n=1 Tax=Solanum tuberosum TaxID=4113 RepID=UPI00073A1C60|nr:PREDICTED: uncharacterized protein LOC107063029 [Solanum tuberosum]